MEEPSYENQEYDPPAGCLLRLFWMIVGNVALLSSAYGIVQHRSSLLGIADAFYWAVVGSLLAARYIDIRYYQGKSADGTPATMAHWRRYAAVVGAVSAGIWIAAHAMAYRGT